MNPTKPTPLGPHNPDAEKSVLGGVLMNNEKFPKALALLDVEDFFSVRHRTIFTALEQLHRSESCLDVLTLKNELIETGALERAGGVSYIAGLCEGVPLSSNVEHYAKIVLSYTFKRDVLRQAQAIAHAITSGITSDELARLVTHLAELVVGRPKAAPDSDTQSNANRAAETRGALLGWVNRQRPA